VADFGDSSIRTKRGHFSVIGKLTRRTRQNHGLEHATVAGLLDRGVSPPLAGYSTPGGFFIFGNASTLVVREAAEDALVRLAGGDRELAISRYCGTTLMTGAMLSGLAAALVLGRGPGRFQRIPSAATAILLATMISRPLGDMLQRRYTTSADVSGLAITGVRRVWAGPYTLHRVSTSARQS
jgi:hypothetical protein